MTLVSATIELRRDITTPPDPQRSNREDGRRIRLPEPEWTAAASKELLIGSAEGR
jgi:hypothetical protein